MRLWRVDDVMTTGVVTVREDTLCHEIVDLLVRRRIGAVPVVDDEGHAIGLVSASDLLPGPYAAPSGRYRHVRHQGLAAVARDVMSRPAIVAQPSLAVDFAARLMRRAKVHRLVVVDRGGRVTGIVTRRDLLRTRLAGESPHQPGPSALPARPTADLL